MIYAHLGPCHFLLSCCPWVMCRWGTLQTPLFVYSVKWITRGIGEKAVPVLGPWDSIEFVIQWMFSSSKFLCLNLQNPVVSYSTWKSLCFQPYWIYVLEISIGSLHSQLPSEKPGFLFSIFNVIMFSLSIEIVLE